MSKAIGKYSEAMYRVSLKAIIRNVAGEVLMVKEKGGEWTLPGGGIDHGESLEAALKRELYEEVAIVAPFTYLFVGLGAFYVEDKAHWQMWVVYELSLEEGYMYGVGVDADEVAFADPVGFKDSTYRSHQLVYKWCVGHTSVS